MPSYGDAAPVIGDGRQAFENVRRRWHHDANTFL
jgi:hypothetical protein